MTLSKRVLLIVAMMIIALVSAACGGGGGGGGGSATDAAKAFVEGIFAGNASAVRDVLCEAAKAELTDEAFSTITEGLNSMNQLGGEIILTGLTYTYNSDAKVVNIGGEIKITAQGQEIPFPMDVNSMFGSNGIPVAEEGGKWTVCLTN